MIRLSILVPAFNEERWIAQMLERVVEADLGAGVEKEIVIVNDASVDATEDRVMRFKEQHTGVQICYRVHSTNQGKGASLADAIQSATGDVMVVQDADLEYHPKDFGKMLEAMAAQKADAVYGSRFSASGRVTGPLHRSGNAALTVLSNAFTGLSLSDVYTCYKMFRSDLLKQISLEERRFGFDPEVTAKLARVSGIRLIEVPISYTPRGFADGKKIGIRDAFRALWCTVKYSRRASRIGAVESPQKDCSPVQFDRLF